MSNKMQENKPKVSELEKVATDISNQCVKAVLLLIGTALESALKMQVKVDDGSARELNTREILIVLANTIGQYVANMEKAEQENQEQPKEN